MGVRISSKIISLCFEQNFNKITHHSNLVGEFAKEMIKRVNLLKHLSVKTTGNYPSKVAAG